MSEAKTESVLRAALSEAKTESVLIAAPSEAKTESVLRAAPSEAKTKRHLRTVAQWADILGVPAAGSYGDHLHIAKNTRGRIVFGAKDPSRAQSDASAVLARLFPADKRLEAPEAKDESKNELPYQAFDADRPYVHELNELADETIDLDVHIDAVETSPAAFTSRAFLYFVLFDRPMLFEYRSSETYSTIKEARAWGAFTLLQILAKQGPFAWVSRVIPIKTTATIDEKETTPAALIAFLHHKYASQRAITLRWQTPAFGNSITELLREGTAQALWTEYEGDNPRWKCTLRIHDEHDAVVATAEATRRHRRHALRAAWAEIVHK